MIIDIYTEVQLAIRIAGVKTGRTTGQVVEDAIKLVFPKYIEEAKAAIKERR